MAVRDPLYACACKVTDDDPGCVVCWVCEQPIATLDASDLDQVCAANIIGHLTGCYEIGDDKDASHPLGADTTEGTEQDAFGAGGRNGI